MSNTSTQGYGTLASQPMMADVYFAFEQSKTSVTPHDLVIFRGNNPIALREFRDRTRKFMTSHDPNFKTSLIPIREDNLGRGCLYAVVPVYNGLRADLKAQLTQHFHNNQLSQWVNTAADPIQRPTDKPKDRVIKTVNPVDYTKRTINRTQLINSYLKQPIGELADLCRQHGLNPSWSKVSMASLLADYDIRVVPAPVVEPTPTPVVEVPAPKPIYQQQLEEFVGNGRLNKLTKAQLVKLGVANGIFFNVKLTNRMPKSQLITILTESVQ